MMNMFVAAILSGYIYKALRIAAHSGAQKMLFGTNYTAWLLRWLLEPNCQEFACLRGPLIDMES